MLEKYKEMFTERGEQPQTVREVAGSEKHPAELQHGPQVPGY